MWVEHFDRGNCSIFKHFAKCSRIICTLLVGNIDRVLSKGQVSHKKPTVSSLVPRPSPAPVFDRLQHTASDQKLEPGKAWELASFPGRSRLQFLIASSIKTEGEGLGERVTCVTSGRREGGGARSL